MTDRNGNQWGPKPPKGSGPGGHWFKPGAAVGEDTLGSAVGELHSQHPWPVHGENVRHSAVNKRHHPVSSSTYKGS